MEQLYHHGINGMKWGKRNGPPYPLDYKSHSRAEKQQNSRSSLSVYTTSTFKKSYKSAKTKEETDKQHKENIERINKSDNSNLAKTALRKNETDIYNRKLSDITDSKYFKTAVKLGVTALAVYGTYKVAQVIGRKSIMNMMSSDFDEMFFDRTFRTLDDIPKLSKTESVEEAMKYINPNFDSGMAFGYNQNCMCCTTSLVMRLKGYDVSASASVHGWLENTIPNMFNSAIINHADAYKCKNINDLISVMVKNGENGSYGNFIITWNKEFGGGGHSILYYIENNTVRFFDSQANMEYNAKELSECINLKKTAWSRLDNCDPTNDVLAWITNSGNKVNDSSEYARTFNEAKDNLVKINPKEPLSKTVPSNYDDLQEWVDAWLSVVDKKIRE